jgi:hypothetical protein
MKRKVFFHKVLSFMVPSLDRVLLRDMGQAVGYPGDVAGEC